MTSQISIRDTKIDATLPRMHPNLPQDIAGFILEHLESTPNGAPA